jgi:endonuclease/exonuclease/phosphatase family metal-dependent hydrolase
MKSSRFRRRAGWLLIGLSLLLHLVTIYAFSRQPDRLAAFTIVPIWAWGGIGLLGSIVAFWFLRAPLSLILTGIWAMTILLGADEARVIANVGKSPPPPGPAGLADGRPLFRVMTLNCNFFNYVGGIRGSGGGNLSADIRRWDPDVVLLQEVHPDQVRHIADVLYQGRGDYRIYSTNGVVTRWSIRREVNPQPGGFRVQQVTVRLPDGLEFEVVNLHLASAETDLRLWRRDCWREHRVNRQVRLKELGIALSILADTAPGRPVIIGGDFNAPPSDPIHSLLKDDFDDAFAAAGTGWGNTYQRRIPIHRIDQIHCTRQFRPLRCSAVTTRHSDHRMVVADLLPSS